MELKQYWNLILRNLALVLVLTFSFGFLGFLISAASPKIYKAESQIFISTPTSIVDIAAMAQGSNFSQQRVISYAKVISGPATLIPVIQELNLKKTPSELAKQISASAPLGTVLLNIQVRDKSPLRAAAIANAVALQFGETIKNIELPKFGDSTGVKASVVRSAIVPNSPATPNTKLNVLTGMILGFIISCLIGIVRQIFDATVKNVEHLNGAMLLGTIDFDESAIKTPLISDTSNYSARSEAFRHLRTSLKFHERSSSVQILAVTSAFPGEGKSTTSINLAISFAQTGLKVALIEADLRRPSFTKYLGASGDLPAFGLTDLLVEAQTGRISKNLERNLRTFGLSQEVIEWLPCGRIPTNPSEALDTAEFDLILNKLRREYDLIIIDTPPTLPVTDAAIVASKADGVLIVVKAGHTRKNSLQGVMEILNNVGAEIFGVVINMVPPFALGEQYGYSYNRYESKYSYAQYYRDSNSEPYAPLNIQGNEAATGPIRIPLDVRLRARFHKDKKATTSSAIREPHEGQKFDQDMEEFLDQMMKKSKKHS